MVPDVVYKFKEIWVGLIFLISFEKKTSHKCIGYDLNVMLQSACLLINPITIDNLAVLINYTPVKQASDSMT